MARATAKSEYVWQDVARIYVVAALLNYVWELVQSPLYAGMNSLGTIWWHCGVAALGDGLLVLLMYGVGRLVFSRGDWFIKPGLVGYALMLVSGLIIGGGMEVVATRILRLWEYKSIMPLVPILKLGFAPVLQMLVLPPLVFLIVGAWRRRNQIKSRKP